MKNPVMLIFNASKIVFTQSRSYWLWFLVFFILAVVLFVLMPVWSVPGNDITFQLSLFTFGNWILFAVLALLIAFLLTMQVFVFRRAPLEAARARSAPLPLTGRAKNAAVKAKNLGNAATGAAGAYAGILGGVFATAACSWCVAAVFGFLGTGVVLFIAEQRLWSVLAAIVIMIASLYFASRRIVKDCGC